MVDIWKILLIIVEAITALGFVALWLWFLWFLFKEYRDK
ncbi:hypothetical protein [Dipodfec virus UOA04_Rod_931]|nr:hypothetical protein [Dipodfec virus UOA04_Rod_931]